MICRHMIWLCCLFLCGGEGRAGTPNTSRARTPVCVPHQLILFVSIESCVLCRAEPSRAELVVRTPVQVILADNVVHIVSYSRVFVPRGGRTPRKPCRPYTTIVLHGFARQYPRSDLSREREEEAVCCRGSGPRTLARPARSIRTRQRFVVPFLRYAWPPSPERSKSNVCTLRVCGWMKRERCTGRIDG